MVRLDTTFLFNRASLLIGAVLMCVLCIAAAASAPPSGRPPVGAALREEPEAYTLTFGAMLMAPPRGDLFGHEKFTLEGAPIVMPVIFLGTYSRVLGDSVSGKLWLDNRETPAPFQIKSGYPQHEHLATITVERFNGANMRWQVQYDVQSWSSRVNDEQAAVIPWPEEWPKEVADGLKPQMYIESSDPVFAQIVQRVTQGQIDSVPPFLAAKELVRHCINEIQPNGDGIAYGELNTMLGMEVTGASEAIRRKMGTPHDLVCACVAVLRAANIPARPVIGVYEDVRKRETFVSWAEMYLPETGWIPFDPMEMRGKGVRTLDVRKPWPEFGTMKDLNERIPLSYHFIPAASVQSPGFPAVWGWDPRPGHDKTALFQLNIQMSSRGRGTEDPK